MPLVWRIVPMLRADTPFDGEGARLHGGRWNSVGVPAVYCASSIALGVLEILVHLDTGRPAPEFAAIPLLLDNHQVDPLPAAATLPPGWADAAAPESTRRFGDAWLRRGERLALTLPSVLVPRETNYLVNPLHPDLVNQLRRTIEPHERVRLDRRILPLPAGKVTYPTGKPRKPASP